MPFTATLSAQTSEQNLESGVKIYNALQEYTKTLRGSTDITPEVLNSVKKRVKDGIALLDNVINEGTADQNKNCSVF